MRELGDNDKQKVELIAKVNALCKQLVDSLFDPLQPYFENKQGLERLLLGMTSKFLYHSSCLTQIHREEFEDFIEQSITPLGMQPGCSLSVNAEKLREVFEGKKELLATQFGLDSFGTIPTSTEVKQLLGPRFNVLYTTFKTEFDNKSVNSNIKQHVLDKIDKVLNPQEYQVTHSW